MVNPEQMKNHLELSELCALHLQMKFGEDSEERFTQIQRDDHAVPTSYTSTLSIPSSPTEPSLYGEEPHSSEKPLEIPLDIPEYIKKQATNEQGIQQSQQANQPQLALEQPHTTQTPSPQLVQLPTANPHAAQQVVQAVIPQNPLLPQHQPVGPAHFTVGQMGQQFQAGPGQQTLLVLQPTVQSQNPSVGSSGLQHGVGTVMVAGQQVNVPTLLHVGPQRQLGGNY